jgi:hypothetical protein
MDSFGVSIKLIKERKPRTYEAAEIHYNTIGPYNNERDNLFYIYDAVQLEYVYFDINQVESVTITNNGIHHR